MILSFKVFLVALFFMQYLFSISETTTPQTKPSETTASKFAVKYSFSMYFTYHRSNVKSNFAERHKNLTSNLD